MKKFFMLTIILLFSLCLLTCNFYNDSSVDDTSINNIKPQNMLSIMLESSDGSGNYVMTTENVGQLMDMCLIVNYLSVKMEVH